MTACLNADQEIETIPDKGRMSLIAGLDFPLEYGTGTWDWNIEMPRPHLSGPRPLHKPRSQVCSSLCASERSFDFVIAIFLLRT